MTQVMKANFFQLIFLNQLTQSDVLHIRGFINRPSSIEILTHYLLKI